MMTLRYKDDVMDNVWSNFFGNDRVIDRFSPVYDIIETDGSYTLSLEIPGVEEENVSIEIKDRELVLEVKDEAIKQLDDKDNKEIYHAKNRKTKAFRKVFKLPEDINNQEVVANMKNGVLTLRINKSEEVQPKIIKVNIN